MATARAVVAQAKAAAKAKAEATARAKAAALAKAAEAASAAAVAGSVLAGSSAYTQARPLSSPAGQVNGGGKRHNWRCGVARGCRHAAAFRVRAASSANGTEHGCGWLADVRPGRSGQTQRHPNTGHAGTIEPITRSMASIPLAAERREIIVRDTRTGRSRYASSRPAALA